MSINVGLIGCGGIAKAHAEAYRAAGASIVAVTDIEPKAAKAFAKEYGAAVFADDRALLESGAAQAVSICTPPVAHADAAVRALQAGVHVLCEKPMAFDVAGAYWMRYAAARSKALLMPAFRHRFLPAIIAFRELMTSGRIGDPVLFNNVFCGPAFKMESTWFTKKAIAGGGSVMDTSSHSVDLFRFLVGEIVDQHLVMHRHFQTTDVEDAGILSVKASNGAIGAMHSAFVAGSGAAFIDIIGTKGRVLYDYLEPTVLRWRLTKHDDWRTEAVAESWGFEEEVRHFLGAVAGEHPLAVTPDDGVRAMEVICTAYTERP